VKTGTTEPFDAGGPNAGKIGETWAFGYTPDYVVGVWAGNSDNTPVVNIYSTSISYRVMRDTLQAAYAGRASAPFARPADAADERQAQTLGARATAQARMTPVVAAARIAATPAPSSKASVTALTPAGSGYNITGSAYSVAMQSYRIEAAPMNSEDWRTVVQGGRTAVNGGRLGEMPKDVVPAGIYSLRVVLLDAQQGAIFSEPLRVSIR
jgi:membrane carboxypeptidase/penicillin-binding protein PbpC